MEDGPSRLDAEDKTRLFSISSANGQLRFAVKIGLRQIESVDHSFIAHEVDFAKLIGGKLGHASRGQTDLADDLQPSVLLPDAEDATRRKIPANVHAVKGRSFIAVLNVAR